jgi:two-component system phosphate regulon response regulator PhoB
MGETIKIVAVLAANPALSSILTMVLSADSRLHVHEFESLSALSSHMGRMPVDLVVCDFDSETAPADLVAMALRSDENLVQRDFHIIALTRTISTETRPASLRAGIDEVIVKPMSPRYLHERILSRLRQLSLAATTYSGPERRNPSRPRGLAFHPLRRHGDNVVNLFPDR